MGHPVVFSMEFVTVYEAHILTVFQSRELRSIIRPKKNAVKGKLKKNNTDFSQFILFNEFY
jgi:hypothetical protein